MYVPNNRASKYMKQKSTELIREIDKLKIYNQRVQHSSLSNWKNKQTKKSAWIWSWMTSTTECN